MYTDSESQISDVEHVLSKNPALLRMRSRFVVRLIGTFILFAGLQWCAEARAQQNLFNVPSGTMTQKEEVFIQEQLNIGRFGESNLTVDYGLGNDWEMGLNVFKVNLYPGNPQPLVGESNDDAVLLNIQKLFRPMDQLDIEIGTQTGMSANNAARRVDVLNFSWCVSRWDLFVDRFLEGNYVFGAYYGNEPFLGLGSQFGFMAGLELPLIDEKFSFVSDIIAGTNDASVAVIGGQYTLSKRLGWQISMGAQLPSPGSGNDYGAVLELTKFPRSFSR